VGTSAFCLQNFLSLQQVMFFNLTNIFRMIALITGASSGIGLEFAHVFAQNGHDVVLVARSKDKLEALADQIRQKYSVQTWVVAADLSLRSGIEAVYDFCQTNSLSVGALVNNAGFGDYGKFEETQWGKQEQMISLNMTALTHLTHLFLPAMKAQKSGKILNVASVAAFQPGPYMSVYFATKAYVLSFSEALAVELEGSGVSVTVLCPGATQSEFFNVAQAQDSNLVKNKTLPTAREVAQYGYQQLFANNTVAIHGLGNFFLVNSARLFPRKVVSKIAKLVMKP
jgi:uncharacterized protein